MKQLISRHPLASAAIAAAAGALVVVLIWVIASAATPAEVEAAPVATDTDTATPTPTPSATAAPNAPVAADCPSPDVVVTTAEELQEALDGAEPGQAIGIADGFYDGQFVASTSGTADAPITVCGGPDAVLDGGGTGKGYVFHLDGAQYWKVIGFTITNGQKGLMADGTVGSEIRGLTVSTIGDEAIHLRKTSTDNLVVGNTISDTGLRKPKFGEGIYIGTAESNWCDISDCQPDPSDRNVIEDNTISRTTAESIDIKEGTSDGIIRGNTFDGTAIEVDGADSWVDVKGSDWLIEGNHGVNSPQDGFQTHEIVDGWGTRNTFRANIAEVNGPGFGFSLTPARDNVVTCDNKASGAGEGLTNVTCR